MSPCMWTVLFPVFSFWISIISFLVLLLSLKFVVHDQMILLLLDLWHVKHDKRACQRIISQLMEAEKNNETQWCTLCLCMVINEQSVRDY